MSGREPKEGNPDRGRQNVSRDKTVHLAYVTSLRPEGKQTRVLRKPRTLMTENETVGYKMFCWGIVFVVWTVHANASGSLLTERERTAWSRLLHSKASPKAGMRSSTAALPVPPRWANLILYVVNGDTGARQWKIKA
jgi:hypothetical protein